MEELTTTESIRKEILADSRKKAAHLLREAEEAVAAAGAAAEREAAREAGEIDRAGRARAARIREEGAARIPLERARMRTALVDRRLRAAFEDYMAGLGEDRLAELAAAMVLRAARGGGASLAGKALRVRHRGLPAAAAAAAVAAAFPGAALETLADPALPAAGIVVEAVDGSFILRATMDFVEEELLSRRRGALSRALCAAALSS